jgi:hypothetical protein
MGLADLIINKDRQITITTPLGEMEIGKTITPKTEGFIHKKVDHRVLLWIETRRHKGIVTDHNLLDPTTDRQIQEEIGVGRTTRILKNTRFYPQENQSYDHSPQGSPRCKVAKR